MRVTYACVKASERWMMKGARQESRAGSSARSVRRNGAARRKHSPERHTGSANPTEASVRRLRRKRPPKQRLRRKRPSEASSAGVFASRVRREARSHEGIAVRHRTKEGIVGRHRTMKSSSWYRAFVGREARDHSTAPAPHRAYSTDSFVRTRQIHIPESSGFLMRRADCLGR